MMLLADVLDVLAALTACAAGVVLLVVSGRRLALAALGTTFVACSVLLLGLVPLVVSLALVTSGAAAIAILVLSTSSAAWPWRSSAAGALPEGRPFRLVVSAFVLVAIAGLTQSVRLPGQAIPLPVIATALSLIALGALQLGLSERSLRVCIGLLTALAGFETLYFVLEPSLGIVALLGSVNVVVALIASYLLLVVRPSRSKDGPP